MTNTYQAAAIQMHAGSDRAANLALATALVEEAAAQGAQLVVLPEFFIQLDRLEAMAAAAETVPGPTTEVLRQLAARLQITLLAGSVCETADLTGKAYNTSVLFGPDGGQLAVYRKMHLFDVDLPGQVTFCESSHIVPGERTVTTQTPLGWLGQAICYDLRFPELFRQLADAGMDVLLFPSAFAAATGAAHWEVLLRARAIENQCYIVAANQHGQHTPRLATFGHSMIIDPWGSILARADTGDAVVMAEIDLDFLGQVRQQLPALQHRRRLE